MEHGHTDAVQAQASGMPAGDVGAVSPPDMLPLYTWPHQLLRAVGDGGLVGASGPAASLGQVEADRGQGTPDPGPPGTGPFLGDGGVAGRGDPENALATGARFAFRFGLPA